MKSAELDGISDYKHTHLHLHSHFSVGFFVCMSVFKQLYSISYTFYGKNPECYNAELIDVWW